MSTIGEHALAYVRRLGLAVFPLRPGQKEPLTAHGFKDASVDGDVIESWWRETPLANIGIPVPPGLVVLDVDSEEALQALRYQDLDVPATVTARTPRGWHFWFRTEAALQPRVGIIEGVDLRAPGSYVVVAPSRLMNGGTYEWKVLPLEANFADAPEWLVELGKHQPFLVSEGSPGIKPADVLAGVGEGFRDATLFRYACQLRARGCERAEAEVLVKHAAACCTPPLSPIVAVKKVDSAWKYDGPKTAPSTEVKIWTLTELLDTDFPQPHWVVQEILPEGLSLVISPAKIGKSFLIGAACVAVANGSIFVRGFLTTKSRVLYLDLEQGEALAKPRWLSILGSKPRPESMTTAFRWPRMDQGGLELLEKHFAENPDLRMVVIDVLAMFWPARGSKGGENAYIWEYRILSQLREIAQRYAAAVVMVHHTNRSTPSDPLDKASGTQAMTGVPDGAIWVLSRERNSDVGELYVVGKNVMEQKLELMFDAGTGGWCLREPRYHAHAEYLDGIGGDMDVLKGSN